MVLVFVFTNVYVHICNCSFSFVKGHSETVLGSCIPEACLRANNGVGAQLCTRYNCDNIRGCIGNIANSSKRERSTPSTWIPLRHPEYGHVSMIA